MLPCVTGWGLRVLGYVKTSASEPERKGVLQLCNRSQNYPERWRFSGQPQKLSGTAKGCSLGVFGYAKASTSEPEHKRIPRRNAKLLRTLETLRIAIKEIRNS
jgi:hypothetical protein